MAGYSGTPLPKKLGIRPGARLLVVGAPTDWDALVAPLPDGVRVVPSEDGTAEVIVCFATDADALSARFAALRDRLTPAGGLWVAWPKKASGVVSDLSQGTVRQAGLAHGLVDNKLCAISDVWSGLRFVYRRKDRPQH